MFRRRMLTSILLCVLLGASVPWAAGVQEESIALTGCLLLSRRVDVYALHMEYNRIATIGHPDLAHYVGHRVRLTGTFEERGGQLRFLVEEIADIAPTCESQASLTNPRRDLRRAWAG